MQALQKQIRRARRRLILQSFTGKLAWCWFVTLLVAAVAIGAGKFWPMDDGRAWALGWLASALAVGLAAAIAWTWARRQNTLEAAVEIDRRFGLKERVSSTLALSHEQLESEIGQALVRDAAERIDRIDVSAKFGLRLERRALLPLLPAVVAFALALGVDGRSPQAPASTTSTAENAQIKKSAQTLAKKLAEQRKPGEETGMPEADALLKQLEASTKELADKPQTNRTQTLVALNDLVKDVEKRRQQVAGAADMKQQLNQLKNLQPGPAQKLGQAMKTGDLKKALQELDKLKEQLAGDKLDAKEKQELAQQLDQVKQALEKAVEAHKQAQEELKEQIESQRKAGNTAQADKLQQQLDKLAQKAPQMEKLGQMAQQLKSAADCMNQGKCDKAADALGKLSDELAGMQKELEELETLDDALEEVADAKNAMNCKECNGEGCKGCQGEGFKIGDHWKRSDFAKGGGIGAGARRKENRYQLLRFPSQAKRR